MSAPDLNTEEGRAAYRSELRRVGWQARLLGFVLIMGGAGCLLAERMGWIAFDQPRTTAAWAAIALGWATWIGVIVFRTRYHRRRLAEGL